jgi:hypothetical protein
MPTGDAGDGPSPLGLVRVGVCIAATLARSTAFSNDEPCAADGATIAIGAQALTGLTSVVESTKVNVATTKSETSRRIICTVGLQR